MNHQAITPLPEAPESPGNQSSASGGFSPIRHGQGFVKPIVQVDLFLPASAEDADDIEDSYAVSSATALAESMGEMEAVVVKDDEGIRFPIVELSGSALAKLSFPLESPFPYLVLHLKTDGHATIKVVVRDEKYNEKTGTTSKGHKSLEFTNRVTMATIQPDPKGHAQIPMLIVPGWQIVPIHLPSVVSTVWGTRHTMTQIVEVSGNVQLAKGWAAMDVYPDHLMPPHLRAVKPLGRFEKE
mmetsp:Transcript_19440/g.44963  ORF Transcript_19440/g.44963 Transcript_19440/m.44963 type:complete len:241 (-) Transcript_19440:381-1103(-)